MYPLKISKWGRRKVGIHVHCWPDMDVKWYSNLENSLTVPQNIKHRVTMANNDPTIPLLKSLNHLSFSKILPCICLVACCLCHPPKLICPVERPPATLQVFSSHMRQWLLDWTAQYNHHCQNVLWDSAALACKLHSSRLLICLGRCYFSSIQNSDWHTVGSIKGK